MYVLWRQGSMADPPVVVPPGKKLGHQFLGLEALHQLDDLQHSQHKPQRAKLTSQDHM